MRERLVEKESDKTMKKIASVVIGLSLTVAAAGVSFAAQTAGTPANSSTTAAKKHVKNHKKANKGAATTDAAAPASAAKK
jgi:hypothetical protein